jgi:hypothetical protein
MAGIEKIVSGGQTGADLAALDFAIERGIPHGGWCPAGRKAEDGTIDLRYNLKETPSSGYVQRTKRNVRDSDGTVIFSIGENLSGGSLKTLEFAQKHEKPWLYLSAARTEDASRRLWQFVEDNHIRVLNVAGSRASKEPRVGQFVTAILDRCFTPNLIYLVQRSPLAAKVLLMEIEQEIKPRCVVRAFSDPKMALRSFVSESRKPDLLITGFLFDGMNGVQLFQECKKLEPRLKVLIFALTPSSHIEAVLGDSPIRPDAVIDRLVGGRLVELDRLWTVVRELLRFKWPND